MVDHSTKDIVSRYDIAETKLNFRKITTEPEGRKLERSCYRQEPPLNLAGVLMTLVEVGVGLGIFRGGVRGTGKILNLTDRLISTKM